MFEYSAILGAASVAVGGYYKYVPITISDWSRVMLLSALVGISTRFSML
jgi:hypothetical protein